MGYDDMKFRDKTHEQEFEALMKRMGADNRDVYRLALLWHTLSPQTRHVVNISTISMISRNTVSSLIALLRVGRQALLLKPADLPLIFSMALVGVMKKIGAW